jgi:predicted site-specific integrase-resolvase
MEGYVTIAEAARRLGISHGRLRFYISKGMVEVERITPRFFLIAETEVERFRAVKPVRGRPRRPA